MLQVLRAMMTSVRDTCMRDVQCVIYVDQTQWNLNTSLSQISQLVSTSAKLSPLTSTGAERGDEESIYS